MTGVAGRLFLLCLLVTLAGCVSDSDQLAEGGIGGTGIQPAGVSVGSISGFGSVIVNGVAYDTSAPTITANGEQVTEDSLQVGFVVRVERDVTVAGARAARVDYSAMVRGPVENLSVIDVDTQTATMSVLGQAVETNDLTAFRDVDLETLRDGDVVEISGVRGAEGEIVPSFFGSSRNRREFRVIGRVSQFDDVTTTFAVSGLTVDFG
ncbi:MAG: DUF5666 domain-containing protein, partial [Gammaproteobacteria bacterium]